MRYERDYVNGTSARKLNYNVYEENTLLKEKRKAKVTYRIKARMLFSILVVFVMGFVVLGRYASITQLNYTIDKYKTEYSELKNKNVNVKAEIQKKTDLNRVKTLAEQKLGMQKPDKYQIVYVEIPKTDYTKVADRFASASNDNNFSLATVVNNIAKFIGFV